MSDSFILEFPEAARLLRLFLSLFFKDTFRLKSVTFLTSPVLVYSFAASYFFIFSVPPILTFELLHSLPNVLFFSVIRGQFLSPCEP